MSISGRGRVGIPVVMIHEGEGCILTVELNDGTTYRGFCLDAEDNMNLRMKDVQVFDGATGEESRMEEVYLRGDQIQFVIFPNILKHAPMFKRVQKAKKGKYVQGGAGLGRTQALRSKVEAKARSAARGAPPMRGGPGMAPPMWGAGAPRGPMPMGMPPRGMPPAGMAPPAYNARR